MIKQLLKLLSVAALLYSTQAFAQEAKKPATTVAQEESGEEKDSGAKKEESTKEAALAAAADEQEIKEKEEQEVKAALVKKVELYATCCNPEAIEALKKERAEQQRKKEALEEAPDADKPAPTAPEKAA